MTTWTIYNHGTGASSLKGPDTAEIINLFGNNDRRPQFRGKLITEGVGSIGDPDKIAFEFSRDSSSGVYSVGKNTGTSSKATRGVKQASGGGVQENVDNTVELIRALNLAGKKPDAINMIGWSRGAVTCIRIAWKLYQSEDSVLRSIPIRIFAVDPVAGFGHNTETDARTLTPNVKYYFATLATGEKRRFFKPIAGQRLHVADPEETKSWIVPMPGHHSDTAKMNNNVGKIVFSLAYRFLQGCGTPVPAMRHYSLDPAATWKLYEEIMIGEAKLHTTGKLSKVLMGGVGYSRGGEARQVGFGETFFPNLHARRVFAAVYPTTYSAYFAPENVANRGSLGWAAQFSPRIVAEQRANGMSQAMIHKLEHLQPGTAEPPPPPANVDLMIGQLGLIN